MLKIRKTGQFNAWLAGLRDRVAVVRINARLTRLREQGHFGDAKPVGDGVTEMRIDHGPGYRLYVLAEGNVTVLLLCGGDKSSQAKDIRKAIDMANQIRAQK